MSATHERGLIALLMIVALVAIFCVLRLQQLHIADDMRREAALVAARSEVEVIQAFGTYYSGVIVPRATAAGIPMTHDHVSDGGAVPYPISMVKDVGASLGSATRNATFRAYSNWPWKFRSDGGPSDVFEENALAAFVSEGRYEYSMFAEDDTGLTVRFASPIVMKESCLGCHNTSALSPKTDWKTGDVRGAISVDVSLPPAPSLFSFEGMHWSVVAFFAGIALFTGPLIAVLFRVVRSRENAVRDRLSDELTHAIDVSKAKTNFLASMSHELRTPLNAIIGFSDMLKHYGHDLDMRRRTDYAECIQQSGRHLLDLVNDLLDLEKIESGAMEIEEADVDLVAILTERISLIKPIASTRGVSVQLLTDGSRPLAYADARMMRQIADNLLSNAIKFSNEGGRVLVDVHTTPSADVLIKIRDEGIGIDKDTVATLFEPYKQANASVSRKFGGTGLGLSIVRQLLRLHEAEIELESAPGRGTTVIITIPKARLRVKNRLNTAA